ncbi:hypothetical protein B0H19DRAFT_1158756 [Mycena capillaripes]|nr:hypothetical protein B0H19DRAFT_1158756 [Mycena capillaripes]
MSAAYTPLPTTAQNGGTGYPPSHAKALLSRLTPAAPPTRIRRLLAFLAVLVLSSTLVVYLVFTPSSLSFSPSSSSGSGSAGWDNDYASGDDAGYESSADGPSSPFFRDTHPTLHARLFLARAQAEIHTRGLNTCGGQLSARMVDAYIDNAVPYCEKTDTSPASITCFPAGSAAPPGTPNAWWPYPQSFCSSSSLSHTAGWGGSYPGRGTFKGTCRIGDRGSRLKDGMGREMFLGVEFSEEEGGKEEPCAETLTHPVLFVPRQDRWNPFHVGEDLVTTFLALTIFSRHSASSSSVEKSLWTSLSSAYASSISGSWTSSKDKAAEEFKSQAKALAAQLTHTANLQLIFQDDYLPSSLFASLYDRIGAFGPRRTGAEGLGEGGRTCFTTAFHSVGAGASLLSATGVGKEHKCASELVWGASLWLRWVWGFEGLPAGFETSSFSGDFERRGLDEEGVERRAPIGKQEQVGGEPIQVLFLSREKFDAYTRHSNKQLTGWQEARHITNEGALKAGLRAGLAGLCRVVTGVPGGPAQDTQGHTPGAHDCTYTDADLLPGSWGVRMHAREARALGIKRGSGSKSKSEEGSGSQPQHDSDSSAGAGAGQSAGSKGGEGGAADAGVGGPPGEGSANERRWGNSTSHTPRAPTAGPRALRFATLDPTTTALAAQIGAVGRADVVVSVHAGALGLTLFMPTGRASVVELVTTGASGNQHFHNMAHMMGNQYMRVDVQKTVDVGAVVRAVRGVVEERLRK